jgi:hypothetical protein
LIRSSDKACGKVTEEVKKVCIQANTARQELLLNIKKKKRPAKETWGSDSDLFSSESLTRSASAFDIFL